MKTAFDFETYALKNSYVLDFRGCPFVTLLDETIFRPSFYIQMAIFGAAIQITKTEIVSADENKINLKVLSSECPVSQFVRLWNRAEAIKMSPSIARASTVIIMALVLLIRPAGLFGKKD